MRNHDVWADLDDWDGEMDTPDMRNDFPEAFWFPCCHQDGTTMGCKYSRHWAADDQRGAVPFPDANESVRNSKDAAIGISDGEEREDEA